MSLVQQGRRVLDTAHVVQVGLVDGEDPVAHGYHALLGRHTARADPADVDAGVQCDPVVGPGSQVEDGLVSLASSPPPHHQRHRAPSTPQGGENSGPVNIPAVQVVDAEDAVVHLQFALDDRPFVYGGDVDRTLTRTDWIIATSGQVETQVLVIADPSHVDIDGLGLPVLQVGVYGAVSAVAVAHGSLQHSHPVVLLNVLNFLPQIFVFFVRLISVLLHLVQVPEGLGQLGHGPVSLPPQLVTESSDGFSLQDDLATRRKINNQ